MKIILTSPGGTLCVPASPMINRADGGNLCVEPPKHIWDRSELNREELIQWSLLIAASGRAMLDVLPQLVGGVINYWEAGNWSLNEAANPQGPKVGSLHKSVHMHLIGRSPNATDPDWHWGEAPIFPTYEQSKAWMVNKKSLNSDEYQAISVRAADILVEQYQVDRKNIELPQLN